MLGTGFGLGVRASISTNNSRAKRRPQAVWIAAAAAAAAVTSLASPGRALAGIDTWSGASGTDNNWQTAGNWDVLPVAGDTLVFGNVANLTPVNNFTAGTSFGGIAFGAGAAAYNLTGNNIALTGALTDNAVGGVMETVGLDIAGGAASSLVLNGGATGGFGMSFGGNTSFASVSASENYTATAAVTLASDTFAIATGKTMTVSGAFSYGVTTATGAGTITTSMSTGLAAGTGGELDVNGSFTVGVTSPGNKNTTTLDLSGLSSVKINSAAGTLNIGNGTNIRGNFTLASGASSVNQITVATISLGTSGSGNAQTGSQLNMGQGTNAIFANTINIGAGKSSGVFQFVGSSANATANIGGTSSVIGNLTNTNITIGSETSGTATSQTSSLLLAGHNVNVQAGTVIIGQANGNTGGTGIGQLTFDTGTFNIATGLQLAVGLGSSTGTPGATGNLTLGGTGTLTISGLFNLGNETNTSATPGTVAPTVTINGGTANINTNIVVASTKGTTVSKFELLGGTLNMNGFAIGGGGAVNSGNAPIGTVNLPVAAQTATLSNLGGTGINGAGLTMNGAGTLIVGGSNNTYSGATTVSSGILQVGTATLAEQLPAASAVTNNATLNFGGSGTATIANAIGGTGVVNHIGSGTTILTNTSNYAGNTGVSAGALVVNGALNSAGNVNLTGTGTLGGAGSVGNVSTVAGTNVHPGTTTADGTVGTLTANSFTASGGDLRFDIGGATSDKFAVTNTATFTGGTISLSLASAPTLTSYQVLTAGALSGVPTLSTTSIGRTMFSIDNPALASNIIQIDVGGGPASLIWNNTAPATGDGATWDVQNNQNWLNGASPDVFFTSDNVTFNDNNNGHYNVTINSPVSPSSVTVDSTGNYVISGSGGISGTTGLVKKNTGSLTLSGTNTYAGVTAVQSGTLKIGSSTALAATAAITLGNSATSGVLDLNGFSTTIGALATSGSGTDNTVTNNAGSDASLIFAGGSSSFGGSMTDGSTNKLGLSVSSGTLTLSGTNTYTGATTISSGATLQIGAGGTSGSIGATAITDNGTVAFNRGDSITDSHTIAGTGAVSQLATSTLTLSGALSYTGATNIATSGTVRIGGATQTLSGAVNGAGNLIVGDGTNATSLTLSNAGNGYTGSTTIASGSTLTIPSTGSISGTSGVTIDGGTEVITSNTSAKNFGAIAAGPPIRGTITITSNGGTIKYGATSATSGLQNPLQINGPLTIDINDNSTTKITFLDTANLSGSGSLLFENTGNWNQDTVQLGTATGPSNSSGYSGAITVGGPNDVGVRLQAVSGATSALGTGPVTVNNGSQVFFGGPQTFTNTFNIAGIGTPVDSPSFGALRLASGQTLSGNINLTGDANISVGTNASNPGALSGQITGLGKVLSLQSGIFTLSNATPATYGSTILTRHDTTGNSGPATLIAGNANAVSSGGMTIDGGALELNGNSMTFANLASTGPNGLIISPTPGTAGTNWFLASSTGSISAGNRISGTGIPIGTFVTATATQEAPTLTAAATSGATTINVSSLTGLVVGQTITATGIPAATTITNITSSTLTLSNALTANIANNAAVTVATGPVITVSQNLSGALGAAVNILHNGAISNDGPATTANATLTFGGDDSSQTLGALILDGTSGGTLGITKVGTGNQTLSNVNTYTGNTNVNAGTLTIDTTGGIASATVNVANGATLTVNSGGSISAATNLSDNGTVNFNNPTRTINTLNGNGAVNLNTTALTISNGGTFSGVIADGAFSGSLTVAGGTLNLSVANTYSGTTTVNSGAALNVTGTLSSATALTANGLTTFAGTTGGTAKTQGLASLTIGPAVTVSITPSTYPFTPTILKPATTSFGTGVVDISNNEFITTGAASDALTLIQGNQIISSQPADATKAIGYIDLSGADAGKYEVRYTLKGDTNLDGTVNVGDLGALATNYNVTGGMSWANGDFTQDGTVNVADLGALATNYNVSLGTAPGGGGGASGASMAASPLAIAAGGSAAVPEPATLSLLGLGALAMLPRRRRRD